MSNENDFPQGKEFGWYAYYKLDRTLAILGIVCIAVITLFFDSGNKDTLQVATTAIAGLVGYIGGRSAK